jgi:hypothetical protein
MNPKPSLPSPLPLLHRDSRSLRCFFRLRLTLRLRLRLRRSRFSRWKRRWRDIRRLNGLLRFELRELRVFRAWMILPIVLLKASLTRETTIEELAGWISATEGFRVGFFVFVSFL